MTSVQIISRKSGLILVEWTDTDGNLRRNWVTPNMVRESGPTPGIEGGFAPSVDRPERGVPYGVDFSRLISLSANSQDWNNALKRRGIWTIADLRAKPNEVLGALHDAYGIDLAAIYNAVKVYEQEGRTS